MAKNGTYQQSGPASPKTSRTVIRTMATPDNVHPKVKHSGSALGLSSKGDGSKNKGNLA